MMRSLLLLMASMLVQHIFVKAQTTITPEHFKNLKARSIGPASMSGRVTCIDAVVENPDIIYIGTASGGVWKTENSGNTWKPIFEDQPILNIGSLAIQQSNPSVIWVGTGEGNPRNSINLGGGIFKSLDGGKSWKSMGLEKTRNIHRILIDPTNPNTIYAAAIGNPYAVHPERGVYKSTDGGESWQLILHTNDTSGCADLVMDPSNPNKLLANMWQHRRTPYSFSSGGTGSGLFITWDGGKSWKKMGKEEGLPDGNYGRVGIAIAPSDPKRIYAMVEATKNGLYRTDDGGFKWELVNSKSEDVTNRPFYFQDIRVDSKNENRLYNVYQMISLSEDGGRSFKIIVPYSGIHPDHHAFWIHPSNPNLIIEGNDGGIGISRDRGKTWKFDEQLPVGQFYHINTDNALPYHIMGGMQDNGTWHGPAYTWTDGGIRNFYWQNIWGGDGFDAAPDPENNQWIYAMSQGGSFGKYNIATGQEMSLRPPAPDLKTRLRFNWNAAFAQDPNQPGTIYYGSQFLHKSTDRGFTWEIISPDLTTNDSLQQKQDENGGLSVDITGAENYNTIICIEPSRLDPQLIWAGTDDGNVQLTRDGGKSWTNFRGKIPGMPAGAWIPQIRASRYAAGEAWVVCNDYRRGDFTPYLFRTRNYGQTWERVLHEKNVRGYVLCVLQDPVEPNLIFAGTEHGLWVSFDNGASFKQWKNEYPSVSTYDLAIQEREADLCIATFGRALYVLDDIRPLRKAAAAKGVLPDRPVVVFDAPTAYQYNTRNVSGYDYSSWGLFEGQNRPRGAEFSFFLKRRKALKDSAAVNTEKPEGAAESGRGRRRGGNRTAGSDSIQVKLYDDQNQLIRTILATADSGFNRMYWGYEMKGIRQPGSPKPKPGDEEPRGMNVFPGRYKLVVHYGGSADSTFLDVKADPAVLPNKELYQARMQAIKRLNTVSEKLTAITDQLSEADEVISKIESSLKNVENTAADSLRKQAKAMTDSIKEIRYQIMGKPQEKQGYGTPYQLTAIRKLYEARTEITRKEKVPGDQEYRLIREAEELAATAAGKANLFFTTIWLSFRQQWETNQPELFKSYKPIQ